MSLEFIYTPFFLTPCPAPHHSPGALSVGSDPQAGPHPCSEFSLWGLWECCDLLSRRHAVITFPLCYSFCLCRIHNRLLFSMYLLFFPIAGIIELSEKSQAVNTVGFVGYLWSLSHILGGFLLFYNLCLACLVIHWCCGSKPRFVHFQCRVVSRSRIYHSFCLFIALPGRVP